MDEISCMKYMCFIGSDYLRYCASKKYWEIQLESGINSLTEIYVCISLK